MVREEVPAQAVFRLHTCGRWGKKCERIEWTIVLCRRCYPHGGSSPRATEENADVQSELNVTIVLAFPLWNRWFRRSQGLANVARKRRLEVRHLLRNVQKRTVISIGYMASRFKSKLCMVLSHSLQPFESANSNRRHFLF